MKQKEIDEVTKKILAINDDPEKIHEFICACANAKSMVENKLHADTAKIANKAVMKSIINSINSMGNL